MEILAVYLYGIYGSITATLTVFAWIIIIGSTIAGIIYLINKHEYEAYQNSDDHWRKEDLPNNKVLYEHMKKLIFIKTSIFLVVLNILIPPKEIAVAMVAVKPAIQIAKDIKDSNRTQSIIEILDLSIARVKDSLRDR